MCQGSVGCATSIPEFLSCWLFKRDAPHCGFVCSWDNKVMNGVASEEGICPHTHSASPSLPLPSHPQSIHTWSAYAHQATMMWRSCGQRNVWAVAFCRVTLQGRGHKTNALATWKNSHNLQEEVEDQRDNVWILLAGVKCQTSGGCCCSWPCDPAADPDPRVKCPSHHHHVHLSRPTNCISWPSLDTVSRWPVKKMYVHPPWLQASTVQY